MNEICFIRVDANVKIGYGHMSRCRVIAFELKKNSINPIFLLWKTDESFKQMLINDGFNIVSLQNDDPSEIISCKKNYPATKYLLLLDTDVRIYYKEDTQIHLIESGIKLIFFTFWENYKYNSHIIINPNPLSLTHQYKTANYTKKLLGPEYMVFDDQFIESAGIRTTPDITDKLNLFISFGGSDLPDRTSLVIDILNQRNVRINECNIVIGKLYKYEKKLNNHLKQSPFSFHVYRQTEKIAEIMKKSNMALCAGGLTLWELAVFNIPSAVISYSDRERITASYLDKKKLAFHIGSLQHSTRVELSERIVNFIKSKELKERSTNLHRIVNINGKQKIISEINSIPND